LGGVIATCAIGGFVSSYWQFSDRLATKPNITINQKKISAAQESQKLRDAQLYVPALKAGATQLKQPLHRRGQGQYYAPALKAGATQYYKLEEKGALPAIPDLPEVNDEK